MSCLLPVWVRGGREVSVPGTRPFVSASAVVAVEWTVICLLVSVCLSQFLRKGRERAWHGAWCSFSKKYKILYFEGFKKSENTYMEITLYFNKSHIKRYYI
jgi:hypothetical protein